MEQQTIDITKMSTIELESLAYKLLKQLNLVQRDIQVVEQEIDKRAKEESKEQEIKSDD